MVISGMGELHLQIYCERLRRENDIEVKIGKPIVSYRETLLDQVKFNYFHKRQTGGAGQFARIVGHMKPMYDINEKTDSKDLFSNLFLNNSTGQNIPNEYILAIEKQFYDTCEKGPIIGYPIINSKFVLKDGETHVVDSSQNAFQNATKYAMIEVFKNQNATLLEPIMKVGISVPTEFYQPLMNSITKRKGNIQSTESQGEYFIMKAKVPLSTMFGFSTDLRGYTQGQGEFSMEYDTHEPVPAEELEDIIKKIKEVKNMNN